MGDVFAIQTEIAEAIAAELRVPLGLDEGEQLVSPTGDLEAYDLYLAGRARMRERGESVMEAIDLFEAAIARDSGWAPAWAGLAESRSLVPYYNEAAEDSASWAGHLDAAEKAAVRALELDPKNASAIVALGNVHRDRWDWADAEAAYVRALTLDPENVEAHQQYAEFLAYVGRFDEAYTAAMRALALDRSPIRLNIAGLAVVYNGRTGEGIELFSEAIRADPEGRVRPAVNNLRRAYLQAGDWWTYRDLLLEHFDARYAETGDERFADRARDLRELWPAGGALTRDVAGWIAENWNHHNGATMFLALGDLDRALEALEFYLDYPGHAFGTRAILLGPEYDELRDAPRFGAILAANGLEGRRPQRLAADAVTAP
jgi:adenylate cyclase